MDTLDPGRITIDPLPIRYRQVNVWHVDLTKWGALAAGLVNWLSPQEQSRAAAYRFEADFAGYVVSHAMLRWLLARYVGESEPRHVRLQAGRHGKLGLGFPQALTGHRFSLSRSHSLAVVAMTRLGRVGIDVERSGGPEGKLSHHTGQMSGREWVRREAVIKALAGSLDDIRKYEVGGESPVPVRIRGLVRRRVDVHDLDVGSAYELAVAVPRGWTPVLAGEWIIDHAARSQSTLRNL